MTSKVLGSQEIVLNDVRYMTVGPVEPIPANTYPEKVVTGDTTRDSDPNLSSMIFSDFRGGIGLDIMNGFETNRVWESNLNLRFKGSLSLGPLVTSSASGPADSDWVVPTDFHQQLYFVEGANIYTYQPGDDTFTDTTRNVSGSITDSGSFQLDGNSYLIFTGTLIYWKTSTTVTAIFSSSGPTTYFLVQWDNRLWGHGLDGSLWYAFVPTDITTVNANTQPGSIGSATVNPLAMWVGYLFGGETAIYILNSRDVYVYDAANDAFIAQDWPIPTRDIATDITTGSWTAGDGLSWRFKNYTGVALDILEHDPEQRILRNISFVGEDGIASSRDGAIRTLQASDAELFALVEGAGTNKTYVYAWEPRFEGWYEIYASAAGDVPNEMTIGSTSSGSDGFYRLYIHTQGNDLFQYINIPQTLRNPKQDSAHVYAASGELKTPWFHADQVDVDKLAARLKVETLDTNSNETVTISYATDYDDDIYSQFDAITTSGIKTLTFPLFGSYLDFDGANDIVTVSDDSTIQNVFDGGGTIEMLVDLDSDGENDFGRLAEKSWQVSAHTESGSTVQVQFHMPFSGTNGTWNTAAADLSLNNLHMLSITYDADAVGNDPIIYIDGVPSVLTESSTPVGTRTTDVGTDLTIGNNAATTRTTDGQIDDVRLWSDTRTSSEVTTNKDAELVGSEDGLVGYWKFNENTGTTANDSSTNSNSGTVSGATWTEHSDPKGRAFRAIRFKIAQARGGTTTNSPRLVSLTLEYRKKLTYKRGYRMILDLDSEHKGRQPGDLRAAFQKVEALQTLAEFTFRENDRMYVDVYREAGEQQSGYDQTGRIAIRVLEA